VLKKDQLLIFVRTSGCPWIGKERAKKGALFNSFGGKSRNLITFLHSYRDEKRDMLKEKGSKKRGGTLNSLPWEKPEFRFRQSGKGSKTPG